MKTYRLSTPKGTLGTFAGVFTPSILTILGIILFLRLGYLVGLGGLGKTLIILFAANAISLLTTISLSAIATNIKVKHGGDYYLISRTLGPEFGGAIGIVLFLAQAISISFYCLGFGEVFSAMFAEFKEVNTQVVAAVAACVLTFFAWLGTDWATRFQYGVMTILALALLSFFIGGLLKWDYALLVQNWSSYDEPVGFGFLFALFFPAVTGFTQGMSMSGDLKDPGKSLPLGSFMAVGISLIIYFFAAILFAATSLRTGLINDYQVMQQIAFVPGLIVAGVFAAALSSGMASYMGAPRILQSLASDRLFRLLLPFAKGEGTLNNPRRGVLLSGAIAMIAIAMGQLNIIAPIVTMFFLISYGLINYATFFEARSNSPNFRPRFKYYDQRLSLLGSAACFGAMLVVDLESGLIAIAILFAIYQFLSRTAYQSRWADGRRSYHLSRIRSHLLAAADAPEHPRDWRPNLLIISDDSNRRRQLLIFASWMQAGSGFISAVKIMEGKGLNALKQRDEYEKELTQEIEQLNVQGFPLVISAEHPDTAMQALLQGFGIGPLRANILLLHWLEHSIDDHMSLNETINRRQLQFTFRLGCNLVLLNADDRTWASIQDIKPEDRRIDVWWFDDSSSRLMLLFAYLFTQTESWEDATIRIIAGRHGRTKEKTIGQLQQTLDEVRIDAAIQVVDEATLLQMHNYSKDAAMTLLPFRFRAGQLCPPVKGSLDAMLSSLSVTALVLAAEDIELDAEPEEGEATEMAEALDYLEDARDFAELAERQAEEVLAELQETQKQLEVCLKEKSRDLEQIDQLNQTIQTLQALNTKQKRRAARAKRKFNEARRNAERLGVSTKVKSLE